MDMRTVLNELDQIKDLPTLPVIAMDANKMLMDYNTSTKKLKQTIEKDQAMVPKMLKLVNSSFFGFQSRISNIEHAIVILGFNMIRNMIVSVSIIEAFSGKKGLKDFDMTQFWTHSVAVAVISRYLSLQTRLHAPEDSFTAGLLHDIGKIILFQYFHDYFIKAWGSSKENDISFYDAEKREIPADHARLGAHLAGKWQLPAGLVDAIRWHHDVKEDVIDYDLLIIVHVADKIVNSLMSDSKKEIDLSGICPEAREKMSSQIETAEDWFPQVNMEIQSACELFLNQL